MARGRQQLTLQFWREIRICSFPLWRQVALLLREVHFVFQVFFVVHHFCSLAPLQNFSHVAGIARRQLQIKRGKNIF